ncbi:pilus (MSHA type) biogenesis protein MshL [Piscinibacter defluvii]|uniref:pilus (MSHA type) biogenesis protein MshL n=1 Tax=Piscinibacter defluvii TaxID=1796922 RepID=UPI000FDEB7B7|nr:pilus (MSHA type) biogenesis protein MshL [Piscinibacter defluvii]
MNAVLTTPRLLLAAVAVLLLSGCADRPPWRALAIGEPQRLQLGLPAAPASAPAPAAAPVAVAPPPAPREAVPPEPRFDLIVAGAQARDVFLSMVADTRYSMLMHPEVSGTLSVTLRGVTMREALESIRDVYGYDFRIDGRRVTVYPPTLQTRIFQVNYLQAKRQGRSELRVSGGSAPVANNNGGGANATGSASPSLAQPESSQVTTSSTSDFWTETTDALRAVVGGAAGRSVVSSPQSGTIAVRAMPDELRQVENFLRSTRAAIERQVMLEAKIVEVELREGFESGVDWSYLRARGAAGQTSGYAGNPLLGNSKGLPTLSAAADGVRIDGVSLPAGGHGALGLSLASNGFAAVLGFLETQGDVQILSSPRVATLNNQKAVLKVGTDEYFVTNVSGGTIATGTNSNTGTTTLPTLTLTPFFSGIALDVTPQIDEADTITLHVHPSVSAVSEKTKQIDLGTIGNYRLPLASSSVNETDTVVRVPDGQIVAIGGLMQQESTRRNSGLPGASGNIVTRTLFGNNQGSGRKKELVVLIRPTIIRGADDWQRSTRESAAALDELDRARTRVITLDGSKAAAK